MTNSRGAIMPKKLSPDGTKNLIGKRIGELRKKNNLSQEDLMSQLQLLGFDSERGIIKRIENGTRFGSDIEVQAFSKFFNVTYEYLIDGKE